MSGNAKQNPQPGSSRAYIIGFALSLALTVEAYFLTANHTFSPRGLVAVLLGLAIVQLLVQLFFFLHLDSAARAPWNIIILLFTGLVVSVVVYGSLWIMRNLNYHMAPESKTNQFFRKNEDL